MLFKSFKAAGVQFFTILYKWNIYQGDVANFFNVDVYIVSYPFPSLISSFRQDVYNTSWMTKQDFLEM